jgi:hypothetical protein
VADDLVAILQEHRTRAECQTTVIENYTDGLSASNIRRAKYARYHHYYAPVDGDQWPGDDREGKIHITANIIKAFIDVESRILSLLPRITNVPSSKDADSRRKSETVEELFLRFLELSGWETWMVDWNRIGCIYGIKVLKPFWNARAKRPDVRVIEQPQNLMIGYGSSDFTVVDWVIYKYFISPSEARRRFPDAIITSPGDGKPLTISRRSDHSDPLAQKQGVIGSAISAASSAVDRIRFGEARTAYEDRQIECWDYWYYNEEGEVYNAQLLQRVIIDGPTSHPEMPRIPYIIVENDHEPGSPEGMSSVEPLIDVQMGLNRAFSHSAQVAADNSGTAYQLAGDNADSVPEGIVPAEDEIIPAGSGNQILAIERNANTFPLNELIKSYWEAAHRISGLPEIMFGNIPSADTSGRVMAIQIEAAANRLDLKRRREYNGLRDLMLFWGYMLIQKDPMVTVTRRKESQEGSMEPGELESFQVKVAEAIKGFDRWNIVAPEITPRDSIETSQNVMQLVNAKLMPLVEGMDRIGLESPEQAIAMIEKERSNARLFPADVQTYASVLQLLNAIVQEQQMAAAQAAQQGAGAVAEGQAAAQGAEPTLLPDQNQGSQPGMAPPPGAPPPGGIGAELQGLVRQTPGGQSQAMSQIVLPGKKF